MQQLMSMNSNQTMTSKELVEVINAIRKEEGNDVEIQHSDLVKRIKGFASILGEGSTTVADYLDTQGKPRPMLLLSKEACLLTVSSESPRVNLAIIRRWQALEQQQQQTLPQTHIEAVEAYLVTLKTVEAQEKQLGIQQKVIAHKNVKTDSSDTHFTIKRIRALNQGMKIDPKILLKVAKDLDSEVETVYDHYEQPINQYSREIWEEAYPDAILP